MQLNSIRRWHHHLPLIPFNNDDDDTTLQNKLHLYQKTSNAKLNWEKCNGLLLGRWRGEKEVPSSPAGLKWNTEAMKFLGVYVGNDCAPLSHLEGGELWLSTMIITSMKNSWWLNLHFLCFADQFTKYKKNKNKTLIDFYLGRLSLDKSYYSVSASGWRGSQSYRYLQLSHCYTATFSHCACLFLFENVFLVSVFVSA